MADVRPISEYQPQKEEVKFSQKGTDYGFNVRGITFDDCAYLINKHLEHVTEGFALWERAKTEIVTHRSMDSLIVMLCNDAPYLVAEVISIAADDRDNPENYKRLPLSVQGIALQKIGKLTLDDAGGLKNLVATLMQQKTMLTAAAAEQMLPSKAIP